MDLGYRVAVIVDATGFPVGVHQIDLERIHHAGGIFVSPKSLYYEWVRTVGKALDLRTLASKRRMGLFYEKMADPG